MEMIIGLLITILVGAFGLSMVDWLVAAWVWLYTCPLHPEIRDRRREEITRDVLDQRREDADAGYRPVEIAARILLRWVLGVPADLSWSGGEWMSFRRRQREAKHDPQRSPALENKTRTFQVTLTANAYADPVTLIARPSPFPGAYLVDGPPAAVSMVMRNAADQMRRAAIFTQQMGMWGGESVVPSALDESHGGQGEPPKS